MSTDLRTHRALTMDTSQKAIQEQDEDNLAVTAVSNAQAFSRLYDLYFPRLYKYILFRVYDAQLADDLVSDVFERILNRLSDFNPGKAPFSAWVFGIARHVVTDALRRQSRRHWLSLEYLSGHNETGNLVENGLEKRDQAEHLRRALRTLNTREKDLVSLKFSSGFTNRQIAALTGLRENNVGIILFRALGKLRLEMNKQEE